MSRENVEVMRGGYERFAAEGKVAEDLMTEDFVWDMSHFHGWPEQTTYEGVEGAREFLAEWTSAWDDWELEVLDLRDAGERVVALVRQSGRSKTSDVIVEMSFAQVWTIRDGKQARMDMYSDPLEALRANGLDG
jgi:uncharacterized protein